MSNTSVLSDVEILSLQLLALVSFDRVPFSCIDCDDKTKKSMNCDLSSEEADGFFDLVFDIHLNSCPYNFIMPIHYEYMSKYNFLQEFPAAVAHWGEWTPREWETYQTFKSYCNKLLSIEQERAAKKQEQPKP